VPIKVSSPATGEFWEIPVLYEDDCLIALDKPAGLPTAIDPSQPDRANLIALLHKGVAEGKHWAATRSLSFIMYAHRLDTEASGVLLFARSKDILARLLNDFGSEKPALKIVALIEGTPSEDHFAMEGRIGPHAARPGMMRIDSRHGKRARTGFQVVERFRDWTLLECAPLTHRRHQVRLHLAYARHRVAGDGLYGGKPLLLSRLKPGYHLKPGHTEKPLLGRACLHASRLEIAHPVTGAPLVIEAPLPRDLQVALKYLRKYGR